MLTVKVLILLLWLGGLDAGPYHRVDDKNLVMVYRPAQEQQARQVAGFLHAEYERLTAAWAPDSDVPLTVIITPSQSEFDRITRAGIPDWGAGCAFPSTGTMVLRSSGRPWTRHDIKEIAVHELVHLLLYRATKGRPVPRWFEEGLAMYESREWRWDQTLSLAKASLTGSLIPPAEIDRVLSYGDARARLAYAESYSAFYWLVEKEGANRVYEMVSRAGQEGFEGAFISVFGYDLSLFSHYFGRYLNEKYHWTVLLQETSLFWLSLVGLFLLAYIMNKIRTRKIVHEWEEQERISYVR